MIDVRKHTRRHKLSGKRVSVVRHKRKPVKITDKYAYKNLDDWTLAKLEIDKKERDKNYLRDLRRDRKFPIVRKGNGEVVLIYHDHYEVYKGNVDGKPEVEYYNKDVDGKLDDYLDALDLFAIDNGGYRAVNYRKKDDGELYDD